MTSFRLRRQPLLAVAAIGTILTTRVCFGGAVFTEKVLASDGVVSAPHTDSNLINPWGAVQPPGGPIWVNNQGKDNATLFDGAGVRQSLTVDIPFAAGGGHGPTGIAFNSGTAFDLSTGGKTGPAPFLFADLDGSIAGWNSTGDKTKAVTVFTSSTPAAYTGLGIDPAGGRLYAVDGRGHNIDVLDSSFKKVATSGDFSDPSVPSGLFPFNAAVLNGHVYVTYTEPGKGNDDAPLGRGAVAEFDLDGHLIKHLSDGGQLATPWALNIAPAGFGDFGGALLVGNFSEDFGQVNAFDPDTGKFLGTVSDKNGNPIRNPYLWSVIFADGTNGTSTDTAYFTAGPEGETRGVFGMIAPAAAGGGGGPSPVPLPPAVWTALVGGLAAVPAMWRARRWGRPA